MGAGADQLRGLQASPASPSYLRSIERWEHRLMLGLARAPPDGKVRTNVRQVPDQRRNGPRCWQA